MPLSAQHEVVVRRAAKKHGIPEDFLCGVVQQESNGTFWWLVAGKRVPVIRPEAHYFYRALAQTTPNGANAAVLAKLASKRANPSLAPRTYAQAYEYLARMITYGEEAAYRSISMGIGQIMGEHAKRLGFMSAKAMFIFCSASIGNQVDIMARFIATDANLLYAAKRYDYAGFARGYNGPGYRKNKYDTSLKAHVMRYKEVAPARIKTVATLAGMGGGGVGVLATLSTSSEEANTFIWNFQPITDIVAGISENAAVIVGAVTSLVILGFIGAGLYKWARS